MTDPASNQQFVSDILTDLGATTFIPTGQAGGIDLVVRTADRKYVEIRLISLSAHILSTGNFRPHNALYIIGVLQKQDLPSECWVIPSHVMERYGSKSDNGYSLNLDPTEGLSFEIYRDRWKLVTEFSTYEQIARDPSSLQIRLALDS